MTALSLRLLLYRRGSLRDESSPVPRVLILYPVALFVWLSNERRAFNTVRLSFTATLLLAYLRYDARIYGACRLRVLLAPDLPPAWSEGLRGNFIRSHFYFRGTPLHAVEYVRAQ